MAHWSPIPAAIPVEIREQAIVAEEIRAPFPTVQDDEGQSGCRRRHREEGEENEGRDGSPHRDSSGRGAAGRGRAKARPPAAGLRFLPARWASLLDKQQDEGDCQRGGRVPPPS